MLRNNEELLKSKFSSTFTHKKAQEQWSTISEALNAMPGANKTWVQWKKTWGDLKKNAKKKNSEVIHFMRGTGGGPQQQISTTEDEEAVMELLETTAVEGDENVMESSAYV
ncbi:uncharacterized protein LOC108907552 [Anoplophora glabripennis]|uniref:uncharacterized protein LOC108907552 n=1 Tax=Anoplophora glabripennis TaxID=217634 RepID=UPI000C789864|nr:uncharacterized protein LOC108907552 [Anoplophora glabripennis]